ncbi:YkuS family protein [Carboxydothermus hydrogenoformans]|uniref:YkuS family protein n=1 Tax=Carboxydothermus hydrogenoformans (strain ATCC BAA-161 / DSM 6008 / Z-2901) TaxID=246194 RepID=Q3AG43_CARHZ|nr:YkuS family protein [Carboxydothermus hydrogenoformans]ABB15295.1 conserved hypothetical protein [Carboxydothermus hydrogenoformans Z-2901]
MKKVAVEQGLSNLHEILRESGYQVVDPRQEQRVDAFVVSGVKNNLMGMQDTNTKAPVINASGRFPEEIVNVLREKIGD